VIRFLKTVYFFSDLKDEEISIIGSVCSEQSYEDREIVFREGDAADRFFIVLEGEVEIWKDFSGDDSGDLLAVRGEGHLFGEMSLVDDLPRSATVRVRGRTRLLCVGRGDFHRIIHENSSIAVSVLKSISLMVRRSNNSFVESLRRRNEELESAYKELQEAQHELLAAERLSTLGKFSSLILHDIRNPISIVRGYAEMIVHNATDESRIVRNSKRIISEADRLNRLAGELLDYSRGEIRLNMQIVELNQFVEDVIAGIREKFDNRGITIRSGVQYAGPVLMDYERMLRVLLNLADNARKAMPDGGEFNIDVIAEEGSYKIIARDTGVGMTKEVVDRIFEPFFSFSDQGGTGLGMSIVKSIVEAHEGTLTVESRRFEGTTFTLTLPKYS
jgi:signal transduction histidine kinase